MPSFPDHDERGWPLGSFNYDYRGLSHWHVSVYAQELALQAAYSLRAFRLPRAAVLRQDAPETFFYAQAMLAALGTISLILKPSPRGVGQSRDRSSQRGSTLRDAFGVGDDSQLLDRRLRDHFTHFDERLDEWAEDSRGHYTDLNIGKPRLRGIDKRYVLRNITPDLRLTFRGEGIELTDLENEIRAFATRLKDGGWQLHLSAFYLAGEEEPT